MLVYTTPAPKGTLSNAAALNGARRATENLSRPTTSTDPSAQAQQRQSSAPTQLQPTSATSPKNSSPLAQTTPTIRTSRANDSHSYSMMNMQSPVMNETLSVINEHIVDMNSPRTSYANGSSRGRHNSMSSAYSSQPPNRMSYIAGHETDEEGHELHTEEEVAAWSPLRVAEYLEDQGVEKQHCDVFLEQEISGDVLLAMEQSSVFMKEFDLGPVGRRLRTWHKIKALQDEVRRSSPDIPRSTSDYSTGGGAEEASDAGDHDVGRARSTSAASALPRGLSTRQSADARSSIMQPYQQQPQTGTFTRSSQVMSPLQSMASFSRPENTYRPSAQDIRSMNHTRRHSSIGSIDSHAGTSRTSHKKQASIDNQWQPGQPITNGAFSSHTHTLSSDTTRPSHYRQSSVNAPIPASPGEMDKGYFSSTEVENRHKPTKNVLQKKSITGVNSVAHSRNSSLVTQQRISSGPSQVPSVSSSQEQFATGAAAPERLSDATTAVNSKIGSFRTTSMPQIKNKPMLSSKDDLGTPIVTKLEYNTTPTSLDAIASSPTGTTATGGSDGSGPVRSPMSASLPFFITKSKVKGLRATSDAVTNTEKSAAGSSFDRIPSTVKEGEVSSPTRTGSTTPSTETRSFDMKPVRSSTGSGNNLMPPPATTRPQRPQRKTKKETSAYTRGLQKKTPAEAMEGADYSGWMKKKSGSLMSTWKPRLFVLRGRRLSYYYSENDTEEKGLIDISFHNVMVAHNEKLTGLHAAMTGAAGASPTSPNSASTFTSAQRDLAENPPKPDAGDEGLFIFKLTPPKSGRGVTFTKPTVHYFAVNSRQEGRLWMAALMKAVIDRDQDGVVTTTYNQKTISLAKARARKERPPALKEEGDMVAGAERSELDAAGDGASSAASLAGSKQGLGIGGLSGEPEAIAERALDDKVPSLEDGGSSVAPSSIMGGSVITGTDLESPALNEKEREAVALNMPA